VKDRTTKTERRAARRLLGWACQWWGTGRVVRLIRSGIEPYQLRLAKALNVPPELLPGAGNHWSGQYWPTTGEITDAPHHPRLPDWFADSVARLVDDLNRDWLQPKLRQIGVDTEGYTVAFEVVDDQMQAYTMPGAPLPYEPPGPLLATGWTFEAPAPLEES
jgi:hypothetical protein